MNQWNVKWKRQALRDLTSIWNDASDRALVTQVVHHLEESLKRSPQILGESRGALRRIVFESPISLLFELVPDDRKVYVLRVGRF